MPDLFSADEARAIFERAARRQHAAPAPDGLTLDDLLAIGREAGLDPALIAAEAAGTRVRAREQTTWHGVPIGIVRSRLLPSRLTDAEWERAVDALRAEFKAPGVTEQIGTRREWASAASTAATRVTVERRGEGDVVSVEVPDQSRLVGLLLGGSFGTIGLGSMLALLAINPKGALVGLVFLLFGAMVYAMTWLAAKATASRTPGRLETLLDRIDLISRSHDARAVSEGRIDPALLDAGVVDAAPPDTRTRTRVR
ncbi:hypothetical protein [Rubrivirga sp. IMCC45206]|uniref:hypothetical protein n=1 Tax=Rubrivirga sp. IMCC45206 TaxID=3391614 RepID=UPI003990396D